MIRQFTILAAITAFFAVTGCHSIALDEDTSLPAAEANPGAGGFNAMGGDGYNNPGGLNTIGDPDAPGGNWSNPADLENSNSGADADGWIPVDPQNRLGMPVIYFAYDSDVLVDSERANLDKIAEYLKQNPSLGLVIEGHCDSRGTDEYNRALGERRANAIRAYLASRGVPDSSLKTMSFGKDKPAVDGSGESIWRQNRRGVPVPMQIPGR